MHKQRKHFLVVTLAASAAPPAAEPPEPPLSNELVDSRSNLAGVMRDRHWQFDEVQNLAFTPSRRRLETLSMGFPLVRLKESRLVYPAQA